MLKLGTVLWGIVGCVLCSSCESGSGRAVDSARTDSGARDASATGNDQDGGARHEPVFPACNWPQDLGPPNSLERVTCEAARALVSCKTKHGEGQICLSDDPTHCSGPSPFPNETLTCEDFCQPNEYVAACGGVGPGPVPDPPANCRGAAFANPAGVAYYCCTCE
jgi:hypothetical protein